MHKIISVTCKSIIFFCLRHCFLLCNVYKFYSKGLPWCLGKFNQGILLRGLIKQDAGYLQTNLSARATKKKACQGSSLFSTIFTYFITGNTYPNYSIYFHNSCSISTKSGASVAKSLFSSFLFTCYLTTLVISSLASISM